MQVPVQIAFRGIPHSEAIKTHIEEKVDKLQQFCANIISCHVVIEFSSKNQHQGNLHSTRITVTVPGKELVSTHNAAEDLYISVREAFDDMTRQLEDYIKLMRHEVKAHQPISSGRVARLFNGDGFGFIEDVNGEEFYFNATHVLHPTFNKLTVGMPVHFVEGMGADGPQAHRV